MTSKLADMEAEINAAAANGTGDDVVKAVEWDSLESLGTITATERAALNEIRSHDNRINTVYSRASEYVPVFMKVLSTVHGDDFLRNILCFISEVLSEKSDFAELLYKHRSTHEKATDPVAVFLKLLNKTDRYIVAKAFQVLSAFVEHKPAADDLIVNGSAASSSSSNDLSRVVERPHSLLGDERVVEQLVDSINHQLQNGPVNAALAVHALMSVVKKAAYRPIVCRAGTIPLIVPLLKLTRGNVNVQLVYEVGFCLWLLTYCPDSHVFMKSENVIPLMHDVLKHVAKEKAIRVCLATLRSLITPTNTSTTAISPSAANAQSSTFVALMISVGVPKTLAQLMKRNFADSDIAEDVRQLSETLEHNINELSSFDEYRQEVLSGRLEWTPVHTSEKFWKENIEKFDADNHYILRELIRLLDVPVAELPQTVALACHDLGQFARFHPRGKKLLTELNAKSRIVELMEADDDSVRKQALLCVQKIMIQNWEFLQK